MKNLLRSGTIPTVVLPTLRNHVSDRYHAFVLRTTLLVTLLCFAACSAGATTLDIYYSAERSSGIPGIPPFVTVEGTGTLSYATGLTDVGLSDLTSFSFNETVTTNIPFGAPAGSFLASFGLTDLTGFGLDPVSSVPLYIDAQNAAGDTLLSDFYLAPYLVSTDFGAVGIMTLSDASLSSPEPAAVGLFGLGLAGCWMVRRKKRSA